MSASTTNGVTKPASVDTATLMSTYLNLQTRCKYKQWELVSWQREILSDGISCPGAVNSRDGTKRSGSSLDNEVVHRYLAALLSESRIQLLSDTGRTQSISAEHANNQNGWDQPQHLVS